MANQEMSDVVVSCSEGVQTLRLNRVAKKNALTGEMYETLTRALKEGDGDPTVKVHLFTGTDGVFCAGNDINDFLKNSQGDNAVANPVIGFVSTLPKVKKPMIAAIDGIAIGIGTTMLFHCDLVYATPSAVFATPFLDLGLVPEAGSSVLMPSRMGYARAVEMLLLGEKFDAERMSQAGVVNKIVPADQLEEVALQAAQRLAAKPPNALQQARALMRGEHQSLGSCMQAEFAAFSAALTSPEAREAFEAFLQKRKPDFSKVAGANGIVTQPE